MDSVLLMDFDPKTDFVLLVDLLSKAGCDVGDINHSFRFVDKWGSGSQYLSIFEYWIV